MDLTAISAAYNGLKVAKDIFAELSNLKIETRSLEKINEAVKRVGEAQDALFQLREELFRLQEENNNLKRAIGETEAWKSRVAGYDLVQTPGGAVVYKSKEGTDHYACPSCIEKKEIQILQDRRTMSGDFECPGCGKAFPVNPRKKPPPRTPNTNWIV